MKDLPRFARLLANAANIIFFAYLLVIASADPNAQLIAAIIFEIAFFSVLVIYRIRRSKTALAAKVESAISELEQSHKALYWMRRATATCSIAVCGLACLYALSDLTALELARCGQFRAAARIYESIAPPVILGIHPAFSLELLSGAYIDAGKFERAESAELELLSIRMAVAGEHDELVATIYCNLADMYRKFRRFGKAEDYYHRSIVMSKQLHLRQGWGTPLTKLGAMLRDEGRYSEAETNFQDAIQLRSRIFGASSLKVRETLIEYESLLTTQGRSLEAAAIRSRISQIRTPAANANSSNTLISIVAIALPLLLLWQRDRLVLALAATLKNRQLKDAVDVAKKSNPLLLLGLVDGFALWESHGA